MEQEAVRQPSSWRAAALVGALSAVLGAVTLGHKSFWFDEAYDGLHVRDSWASVFDLIGTTEMSQAAYLVLLKAWATVTPDSEIWLRLPSVLAAALAAALLVPLGTRLFDRTTGIVAGVLLATNELLVRWSQQARTYALVTLAVVVASFLLLRALDDPRRRNWLLYAIAAAVAVYCHFYAGLVVVAHFASLPFAPRRPPLRRVLEAGVAFLILIGPALYFTATAQREQLGWIEEASLARIWRLTEVATGHNAVLGLMVAAGLALLAYEAGAGTRIAGFRLALVGGWVALPIVLGLLVSAWQPILVPRYAIVITPALALAGAVAIAAIARARREVAACALVVLIAVSGYRIVDWYRGEAEDWRGAVAYVASERRPNDAVIVAPKWATDAFRYYDTTTPVAFAPPTGRTIALVRATERDDPVEIVSGVLGPANQLEVVSEQRFGHNLRVQVLEPPR